MAPGCPLVLLCLLVATCPYRAEGDPAGAWGKGTGPGRALGARVGAQWSRPSSRRTSFAARAGTEGDAGAGGSGAEVASHWLGAGYPRRKRGRRGGSRSARSGGDSGSNITQFDPGS